MKYRVTIEIDTTSGDYELLFNNLTNPGEGVDYNIITEACRRIFGDFDKKMGNQIDVVPPSREDN